MARCECPNCHECFRLIGKNETAADDDWIVCPLCGEEFMLDPEEISRGRKILAMIPVLVARTNELVGAEDLVIQVCREAFNAASLAAMGPDYPTAARLMVPVTPLISAELQPKDDAPPDAMYIFRRGDAPS